MTKRRIRSGPFSKEREGGCHKDKDGDIDSVWVNNDKKRVCLSALVGFCDLRAIGFYG